MKIVACKPAVASLFVVLLIANKLYLNRLGIDCLCPSNKFDDDVVGTASIKVLILLKLGVLTFKLFSTRICAADFSAVIPTLRYFGTVLIALRTTTRHVGLYRDLYHT